EWYLYETVIDGVTLGGFGLFLLSGVTVHYAVLYAIQTTKVKFMNPFLIFQTFSVILEIIIALTAVGELVSNQSAHIEDRNKIARVVILSIPFCICAQLAMIYSVVKCKAYVKRKASHLLRIRSSQGINQVLFNNKVWDIGVMLPVKIATISSTAIIT
uniref:Uncharacterized protein n=1 Tax=Parascaris univalens TaxID=6257 RepID=A0A915CCH1_PARUN